MFEIALYQPEIPPNTGNIIRLCANIGATLHLIHPLGFSTDDKQMRRAGLDYHQFVKIHEHKNYEAFMHHVHSKRIFACTTKGVKAHTEPQYIEDDVFLFGPETRGLPDEILDAMPENRKIYIPMLPQSRSLNLANACGVILYEAWRHLGFGMPEE